MIETRMIVHGIKAHLFGKACPICDSKREITVETTEMIAPKNTMMRKSKTKKVR